MTTLSRISSCVLGLTLLLQPASAFALTKQVAGNSELTVVDKRDYPIIFVHGAAGAELEAGGTNVWPGYVIGTDEAFSVMALRENGINPCCGTPVKATGVLKYGAGFQAGPLDTRFAAVYQGFYDYMEAQGYGYEKKDDGKVFYDFVYDWRKDNTMWTRELNKKVDQVLEETKAEKVILVGHSMGGLQIRLYMKEAAYAKKVGGVIFLATPHHGAPQVYWAYTYGYNFGNIKVSNGKMWEIMANWPAGYQLLPDYPFVKDAKTGETWSLEKSYLSKDFITYQEYQYYLKAVQLDLPYEITGGLRNPTLAKKAIDFHKELGDSVTKYPGLKYIMISGGEHTTLESVTAELRDVGLGKPLLVLTRNESTRGDETVPEAGARIEGVDEFISVNGDHGSLPSNEKAQFHVTRVRKEINNEIPRQAIADLIGSYAEKNLPKLKNLKKSLAESATESSADRQEDLIARIFTAMFFGVPDEEKIKLRDSVSDSAVRSFENAQVNVYVPKTDTTEGDTFYLTINNFAVGEYGPGEISPATVNVEVDSMETLKAVTKGELDPQEALRAGKLSFGGTGIVERFKLQAISWIARYVK